MPPHDKDQPFDAEGGPTLRAQSNSPCTGQSGARAPAGNIQSAEEPLPVSNESDSADAQHRIGSLETTSGPSTCLGGANPQAQIHP